MIAEKMTHKVFISYASPDKAIANKICSTLESREIPCWIAPRDVAASDMDYGQAIVGAIKTCSVFVILLSSHSNKSTHVPKEVTIAHEKRKNIVVCRAEPVSPEGLLEYHLSGLHFLDIFSTPIEPQLDSLADVVSKLRSSLFKEIVDPSPQTSNPDTSGDTDKTISIASLKDVVSWGWNGKRFIDSLIDMDYDNLGEGLDEQDEGVSDQWAPTWFNHPDTGELLITGPEKIIGYWHFVPLFENEFDRAQKGELLDSEITVDLINPLIMEGFYDIYFIAIVIQPEYRGHSTTRLLFHSLFNKLTELAENDIFINKICANAYTPEGEAICRHFGMKYLGNHKKKGKIFSATFFPLPDIMFWNKYPKFRSLYKQAFAQFNSTQEGK